MHLAKAGKEDSDYAYLCSLSKEIICRFSSGQCSVTRACRASTVFALHVTEMKINPNRTWEAGEETRTLLPPQVAAPTRFPCTNLAKHGSYCRYQKKSGVGFWFWWSGSANLKQMLPSQPATPLSTPPVSTSSPPHAQTCHRPLKTIYGTGKKEKNVRNKFT